MTFKNRCAFTLVELMVVIGIIGLLAGVALPNFLRAAKLSRKTSCQNNLKLLNDAGELYLFDHLEVLDTSLISPAELCGAGKYIKEDVSKLYCPEGQTPYPGFYLDKGPVCSHGPTTTTPAGDGTFPEHYFEK